MNLFLPNIPSSAAGLTAIFTLLLTYSFSSAFTKNQCEFRTANYSVEWAFEPTTKSVVLLLKAAFLPVREHAEDMGFWTGVGFSNEKLQKKNKIDFVGIFARTGQVGLLDGHLDSFGVLIPDNEDNVRTITLKTAREDGSIIAKFVRPIFANEQNEEDASLLGCTTFYFPDEMRTVSNDTRQSPVIFSWLKKLEVCDIENNCRIEVGKSNEKLFPKELGPKEKHEPPIGPDSKTGLEPSIDEKPEAAVAHSVEREAGKGDPCSFTNSRYSVSWYFDNITETVNFVMRHKARKGHWWSAIGIGDNMSDLDIGVLFLENGNLQMMIDYYSDSYGVPVRDTLQNWAVNRKNTRRVGDIVELHFSRGLNTADISRDKTMDGCVLFHLGANAGTYGRSFEIHKHDDWPDLYKTCNIKTRCLTAPPPSVIAESIDEASFNLTDSLISGNETTGEHIPGQLPAADKDAKEIVLLLLQKRAKNADKENEIVDRPLVDSSTTTTSNGLNDAKLSENNAHVKNSINNNASASSSLSTTRNLNASSLVLGNTTIFDPRLLNTSLDVLCLNLTGGDSNKNNNRQVIDHESEPRKRNTTTTVVDSDNFKSSNNNNRSVSIGDNKQLSKSVEDDKSSEKERAKILTEEKLENIALLGRNHSVLDGPESSNNSLTLTNHTLSRTKLQTGNFNLNGTTMTGPSETINATTEKVELLKSNISTPISNGNSSAHQENGILINKMDKRGENKNLTETIEVSGNATKKAGQPEEVADSGASASKPQIIKTMESRLETLNNTSGLESPKNETSTQTSIPSSSPSTSTEKVEANKPTPPPENTSEQQLSTKIPQALNETETIAPTIKSVNDSMSNSTINTKKDKPMLPVSDGGCDALKPDLPICKSYMENYLGKVKDWAERHGETLEQQYGKACKLLNAVPHIPTLCCQIFTEKCHGHL